MSKNKYLSPLDDIPYKGLGISIGLVLGCLIGCLIGTPIIFAGGCMVLGLAIGTALEGHSKQF